MRADCLALGGSGLREARQEPVPLEPAELVHFATYLKLAVVCLLYTSSTFIVHILNSNWCCGFFFFFIHFSLKDNCFTEFCCFLSNLNRNQP